MAKEFKVEDQFGYSCNYHKPGKMVIDFHERVARMQPHSYPDEAKRKPAEGESVAPQQVLASVVWEGEDWDNIVEPIIAAAGDKLYKAWGEKDPDVKAGKDV